MFIKNATYKSVPTDGLTFPVSEGTIISGGIVPETVALEPPTKLIYVATSGTIELNSEANANVTFTDDEITELGENFNFVPGKETEDVEISFVLDCTESEGVTIGMNGTYVEINFPDIDPMPLYNAFRAGKLCVIRTGEIAYDEEKEEYFVNNDSPANVVLTYFTVFRILRPFDFYACGNMPYVADDVTYLAQVYFSFVPDVDETDPTVQDH